MSPKTQRYEDIEIRYGYAITDDQYHAHFELPADRHVPGDVSNEAHSTTPVARSLPGKMHIHAPTQSDVLDEARRTIDRFLGK